MPPAKMAQKSAVSASDNPSISPSSSAIFSSPPPIPRGKLSLIKKKNKNAKAAAKAALAAENERRLADQLAQATDAFGMPVGPGALGLMTGNFPWHTSPPDGAPGGARARSERLLVSGASVGGGG